LNLNKSTNPDSLDSHLLHPAPTQDDIEIRLFTDHDRVFGRLGSDGDGELTEVDETGIAVGSHGGLAERG
jgi:hypothetical protein